jgi:lysozyme
MNMSEQGMKLLHEREGRRTKAYRDSKGYWTIGLGHLLSRDVNSDFSSLVWTQDQVEKAWLEDKAIYEKAVNDCVKVPLKQHQFDALVSFAFNCGVNALPYGSKGGPSSILRALNAGDYMGAGLAFNNWMADPEVRTRRAGEREQFLGRHFVARFKDLEESPIA